MIASQASPEQSPRQDGNAPVEDHKTSLRPAQVVVELFQRLEGTQHTLSHCCVTALNRSEGTLRELDLRDRRRRFRSPFDGQPKLTPLTQPATHTDRTSNRGRQMLDNG